MSEPETPMEQPNPSAAGGQSREPARGDADLRIRASRRRSQRTSRSADSIGSFRRALLFATIAILPLQDHLPPIGRFSVMYIAFAVLACVALIGHPVALFRAARSRVVIPAYVFLLVGALIERLHPNASYDVWLGLAQMIAGAVVIASYCRDPRDISAALHGLSLAALWVAVTLVSGSHAALSASTATDFGEASRLRVSAMTETGLRGNWNTLAFLCAAGASLCSAWAILTTSVVRRIVYIGIALVATVGAFVTFSRGGVIALVCGLGYVLYSTVTWKTFLRTALVVMAVGLVVAFAVPSAVFARLSFPTLFDKGEKQEARIHVYSNAIRTLPGYIKVGVGAGNFWDKWAVENGFEAGGRSIGAHSTYLQMTIYWGFAALVSMMAMAWVAWRALSRATRAAARQWIPLKAMCLVFFLYSLVVHSLQNKQFSILIGLIAGVWDIYRRRGMAPRLLRRRLPQRQPGHGPMYRRGRHHVA